jgi:hypothetical protein
MLQAEKWAIAAAAQRFLGFPCGDFLFFDFRSRGSEKKKVCPVVKKNSRQIVKRLFLFDQSYIVLSILSASETNYYSTVRYDVVDSCESIICMVV